MCILALDKVSLKSEDILTTANYFATRTIQTVPRSPDIVEGSWTAAPYADIKK